MLVTRKKFLCMQKNGNYIISVVTLWRQMAAFLKFSLLVFISWGEAQTKTVKVAIFRKVSVKPSLSHYLTQQEKIAVRGKASVSWQCRSWHLLILSTFCPCFSSVGKPPGKKSLLTQWKTAHINFVSRGIIMATLNTQLAQVAVSMRTHLAAVLRETRMIENGVNE